MRHPEIAAQLRRLIHEEQFDEAETLIPQYVRAVTDECVTAADESSFGSAREFLRQTIVELRARRAHMAQQLQQSERARPYLVAVSRKHEVDMVG